MSDAALWLTVVALGAWHGLNPAMGWPLAVAAGLERRREAAVFATWLPLAAGHLLAMAALLLPFAAAGAAFGWSRAIRLAAGALVLGFGLFRLLRRRHPRALARVPPTRLVLWSFLMASAHGAGLMLLPVLMPLCYPAGVPAGGAGPAALALAGLAVHTASMLAATAIVAGVVYEWVGVAILRHAWLNVDALWIAALGLCGAWLVLTSA